MRDRPPVRLVEIHSGARVRLEGNGHSGFIPRILDRELSRASVDFTGAGRAAEIRREGPTRRTAVARPEAGNPTVEETSDE